MGTGTGSALASGQRRPDPALLPGRCPDRRGLWNSWGPVTFVPQGVLAEWLKAAVLNGEQPVAHSVPPGAAAPRTYPLGPRSDGHNCPSMSNLSAWVSPQISPQTKDV